MSSIRSRHGFAPRLETLEDRRCPSVSALQDGDTLRVAGSGNDTFTVAAIGRDAYQVRSGTRTQNFADVEHLRIGLGNGTNDLTLRLDPRVVREADVSIRGSNATSGTDNVTVNLGTGLGVREHIDLNVNLGNGANNFTLGGTLGTALQGATLNGGSELDLDYRGGSGGDTVVLNFWNINKHAEADVDVRLGAGNDSFAMNLPTSRGNGIFDNRAEFDLSVDGGAGNDTATFTGRAGEEFHVHVRNVEHGNLAQFADDDDDDNGDDDNGDDDNGDDDND